MAETMRVAVCTAPGRIEIQRRPVPDVAARMVLMKVAVCGVCASDVAVWRGSWRRPLPYSPGHEFCGTVARIGPDATRFHVGQRVVIDPNLGCGECRYCKAGRPNLCDSLKTRATKSNGGLSDYVAVEEQMVFALPDAVPDELAPFIEPLSCALHAAQLGDVNGEQNVVVFGAGMMGILIGLVVKAKVGQLTFVEPDRQRREQAARLFDTPALRPEEVDGDFDLAIDCSGSVQAVCQAITVLRKTGQLVLAGVVSSSQAVAVPLAEITRKELRIEGAWLNPHTFMEAIHLAVAHMDFLKKLTTATFGLADVAAAFEAASEQQVNRVLVKP